MTRGLAIVLSVVASALATAAYAEDESESYVLIEDSQGNPLYAADSDGNELTFIYDEAGEPVAVVDQDDAITDLTNPGWTGAEE